MKATHNPSDAPRLKPQAQAHLARFGPTLCLSVEPSGSWR